VTAHAVPGGRTVPANDRRGEYIELDLVARFDHQHVLGVVLRPHCLTGACGRSSRAADGVDGVRGLAERALPLRSLRAGALTFSRRFSAPSGWTSSMHPGAIRNRSNSVAASNEDGVIGAIMRSLRRAGATLGAEALAAAVTFGSAGTGLPKGQAPGPRGLTFIHDAVKPARGVHDE
jgi:hypothetical protein